VWWLYADDGTQFLVSNGTSFIGNLPFDVATQAWSAAIASAPTAGYAFQSGRPVDANSGDIPLIVSTVDIFGQTALLDMISICTVLADPYMQKAPLLAGSTGVARQGVLDFSSLNVRGDIGAAFAARVSCVVDDGDVPSRGLVVINIAPLVVGACRGGAAPGSSQLCSTCLSGVRVRRGGVAWECMSALW
jgi:hypothetical protein